MSKLNWLFLFLLTALLASGCYFDDDDSNDGFLDCESGQGGIITEELNLNDFNSIELRINAEVRITQGSPQRVVVEGQENIIDLIELDVQNDNWEIEFDRCVRRSEDLKFFITIPDIRSLHVSGSGLIFGENTFVSEDLILRISGSGDIDLAVDTEDIDSRISGSGRVILEGNCEEFEFKVSGSGDYEAFGLQALEGEVDISGSGDADVRVEEILDVDISGSGDVRYKGRPILNVNISGSGRVIDAN
ncbi:MAG: head GIN domain-containing protein [Bacteroidota bacterium]